MSLKFLLLVAESQVVIGAAFLTAAGIVNGVWHWRFPGEATTRRYSPTARKLLIAGAWLFGIGAAEFLAILAVSLATARRH